MPKAGKLTDIDLNEISGVDEAANKYKGWMIFKNMADNNTIQNNNIDQEKVREAFERATQMAKDHASLLSSLESSADYLADAPDDVKKAVNLLYSYLRAIVEEPTEAKKEEETEETQKSEDGTERNAVVAFFSRLFGTETHKQEEEKKEAGVTDFDDLVGAVRETGKEVIA